MSTPPPPSPLDNESRVSNVIAMVAGTLTICAVTTGARIYTRLVIVKNFGIDDGFALLSLLCTIGCGVAIALNTENGIGRHIWTIDMSRFPLYLKIFYVSIVMYGAAITAVKATFLLQYQRVFSVGGYVNRFLWAFIVVMAWSVASLLIAIFTCVPVASFWDQSVTGHCVPEHPWWEINSAGNVITDFAVFCLPLPTLWRLHLPRPQKIALLGLFSLGFFTCILSIVRIKFLHIQDDLTWGNVDSGTWSMIELTSGITCANLATLRPLFKTIFPSLGGMTSGHSGSSGPNRPSGGISANGGSHAGDKSFTAASGGGGWSMLGGESRSTKRVSVEELEMQTDNWKAQVKGSRDAILR